MILYWIKPQTIDIHVYLDILITRGSSSWSRKTSFTMATWNKQLKVPASWCHFRHAPLSLKTHSFSGRTPHTHTKNGLLHFIFLFVTFARHHYHWKHIRSQEKHHTQKIYGII